MKSGFHLPVGESENKLEKACVQEITGSKWLKEEPFPLAKSELRGKRKNNFILYLYAGKRVYRHELQLRANHKNRIWTGKN